jgi:hypothetical protein
MCVYMHLCFTCVLYVSLIFDVCLYVSLIFDVCPPGVSALYVRRVCSNICNV